MTMKEKHITKTTLKGRGWTEALIKRLLPEPFEVPNPYYSTRSMYLWNEKDVIEAEENPAFLEYQEKRKVYRKRAASAVRTKNEKMQGMLNDAIAEVKVMKLGSEEVRWLALAAKQNWYDRTKQYERNAYIADYKTVQRWTVNYIRHTLTTYDSFLFSAKGKTGISFAYPLYRKAVLQKIADTYPDLQEECRRQMGVEQNGLY